MSIVHCSTALVAHKLKRLMRRLANKTVLQENNEERLEKLQAETNAVSKKLRTDREKLYKRR